MKKILIVIILIIGLSTIFGIIDTYRFENNQEPIFTFRNVYFKEGGTEFRYGLGYQLIDWHVLDYDQENERSFYYTKKETKIFPFLKYKYSLDESYKTNFEISYE